MVFGQRPVIIRIVKKVLQDSEKEENPLPLWKEVVFREESEALVSPGGGGPHAGGFHGHAGLGIQL